MAFRFCDSFDHYATAQLTLKYTSIVFAGGGGSSVVIAGGGRTSNALLVTPQLAANTYALITLDNQPTWIVGFALNVNQLPIAQLGLAVLFDSSSRQVELSMDTSGHLLISRNGTTLATSTNVFSTVGFNYVEWKMTIASSISASTCVLKVNGAIWLTLSAGTNTKATSNATANGIALGDVFQNHTNSQMTYDDYYVLDGTGSVNNDFLGDVTVEARLPNADGNHLDFSITGSASAHLAVNESPPDGDTTYVYSNTTNNRESFLLPVPQGTVSVAYAIQTVLDVRKQGSGNRSVAASLRISSTDYDGATTAISTSYLYYAEARNINPATGVAWTASDFNSLEVGMKVVS